MSTTLRTFFFLLAFVCPAQSQNFETSSSWFATIPHLTRRLPAGNYAFDCTIRAWEATSSTQLEWALVQNRDGMINGYSFVRQSYGETVTAHKFSSLVYGLSTVLKHAPSQGGRVFEIEVLGTIKSWRTEKYSLAVSVGGGVNVLTIDKASRCKYFDLKEIQ